MAWRARQKAHEAEQQRVRARDKASALALMLTPRQRVQAAAGVLLDAGRAPQVKEARIWWECGHITEEGAFGIQAIIVGADGLPTVAPDSCPQQHEEEPRDALDLVALGKAYSHVADMTPADRETFVVVKEGRASGRGWRTARRSTAPPKPTTPPKPSWTLDRAEDWCKARGIDLGLGVQALWRAVLASADADEHPPRRYLEEIKRRLRDQ